MDVIAAQAGRALHILDRFRITKPPESGSGPGAPPREHTPAGEKRTRSPAAQACALVPAAPRQKLEASLASTLATARARDFRQTFRYFWPYNSPIWAGAFLDYWCYRAMSEPSGADEKVARMLGALTSR